MSSSYKDDADDEEVLQATLAASQIQTEVNPARAANEVLYKDGATPLFAAIEETKWSEALDLLEVDPEQASTWVMSTGTENTTFGWSLWRRLPIHEACRRQAPVWLVAALLQAHPSSIVTSTHFGELPLHLAVEMGAAPEVINLLLVNFYPGIHVEDNSGRTPMQINLEADAFNMEDHMFIQESLTNAHHNLEKLEAIYQEKLDAQAAQHEEHIQQIMASHDESIRTEQENQSNLQQQLSRTEGNVQQYKEERKALEKTLTSHHVEKGTWQETLERKEETLDSLIQKIKDKDQETTALQQQLEIRSEETLDLMDRVETLEQDLRNITMLQQDSVAASMRRAEEDIQRMLASQSILAGRLQGQSQGLALLLQEREICWPPPPPPPPAAASALVGEEQHTDDRQMKDVSAAAAMAATAAITLAEYEEFEKDVFEEVEDEILQQESILENALAAGE